MCSSFVHKEIGHLRSQLLKTTQGDGRLAMACISCVQETGSHLGHSESTPLTATGRHRDRSSSGMKSIEINKSSLKEADWGSIRSVFNASSKCCWKSGWIGCHNGF